MKKIFYDNKTDLKPIRKGLTEFYESLNYVNTKKLIKSGTYNVIGMIDASTKDNLIGPSKTEKTIFEEYNDTLYKTNEKIMNDYIKEKINTHKDTGKSLRYNIIKGLRNLDKKKK